MRATIAKIMIFLIILVSLFNLNLVFNSGLQGAASGQEGEVGLLRLLGIEASEESIDYVVNKTQFQLHTLLTEQRHPKTWNLSDRIRTDTATGLRMLFSVDEDVAARLAEISRNPQKLDQAAQAVSEAILSKRKVYIYGCGATGRLAKQMESTFWRPFWASVLSREKIRQKIKGRVTDPVEDALIGEMTGADRALISSLEGFEDLQLIGRLQLEDRGVTKDDVVICVTEGGETSSVIGTVLAALDLRKADPRYDAAVSRRNLYFIYNNPDDRLLPFARSRRVIEEPGITKVNLTTGPQAITGSTRMQATTIETYVVGTILEAAVERTLKNFLSSKEMAGLGFGSDFSIGARLNEFGAILEALKAAVPEIAGLTDIEAATYGAGNLSTYFAKKGLITVFIDSTERSPTFRLYPLDTVNEPRRKCWIQVWTPATDIRQAWLAFLGRPFRGLDPAVYMTPFENEIDDPYLRRAALESLKRAGNDQQDLYDFSFAEFNRTKRGPKKDDLGVVVFQSPEEAEIELRDSSFRSFAGLFAKAGAKIAAVLVSGKPAKEIGGFASKIPGAFIPVSIDLSGDALGVKQQVATKVLLNAHSTAVMAKLGRVVGNTMTNVSPSNLKLIGRATYLIQSHVNDALGRPQWLKAYGRRNPVSYGEANAVLFDSIAFLKDKQNVAGQTAEVALSIIRILESLRERRGLTPDEALDIVRKTGLSAYLSRLGSNLHI